MVSMVQISRSNLQVIKNSDNWYQDYENLWDLKKYNPAKDLLYLGMEVVTGGMSGGNCWGGTPSSYTETEQFDYEAFFMALDSLGFISLDDMSIKNLFKLKAKMIQKDREIGEYYGNFTKYSFFGFPVKVDGENILLDLEKEDD